MSMKADELERSRDGKDAEENEQVFRLSAPRVVGATPSELNLVGLRVEEAIAQLGPFIDRSVLARLPEVRIVHGFGSGRLRNAVQEWLANNPLVREFHTGRDGKEPGGGGCTIVTL